MTPQQEARRAMRLTLAFDVTMAAIAMVGAHLILWLLEPAMPPLNFVALSLATGLFVCAALAGFILLKVNQQVWRHMGWSDAIRVGQAVGLSVLISLPFIFILNGKLVHPLQHVLIATLLWGAALLAGRMYALSRSTKSPLQIFNASQPNSPPTLLVGDAAGCADALRRLQHNTDGAPVRVLGMIETGGAEPGRAIRGVPVMGGLEDLGQTLEVLSLRYGEVPWVATAGAARERANMNLILEVASSKGAKVMALGNDEASLDLEAVRPADLLARPEKKLDTAHISDIIKGSKVLVTGGGGTIGSELTRQVAALQPASLTIVDASEYNLYSIDNALRELWPTLDIQSKLGDVRDVYRLRDVMQLCQPDVVIHAAALKHVPLMEQNVCEAILTNVGGAINAAEAAVAVGAKRFVFISTDKAVDPDNVMGATKRLAEIAVSRVAANSGMSVSMVRFGNVLGSSGSVVPRFEKQIAAGGPVTLTHPDVTRFFMTVEEASSLVLQAATLQDTDSDAGLFVLDMGDAIPIKQLAEAMIRLKGKVPERDIKIEITGLRPGEKMHEVLVYDDEEVTRTDVEGVLRVASRPTDNKLFQKRLAALLETASRRERTEALRQLGILVPEYGRQQAAKSETRTA